MRRRRNNPFLPFLILWALLVVFVFIPLEYHRFVVTWVNGAIALTLGTMMLFGIDKYQAIRRGPRVPENLLYLAVAMGGSLGALLGMNVFRHKTQKVSFQFALVIIILAQLAIGYGVFQLLK